MSIITIIIISLLFSAFFSGMEIAFVSSNKLKIELKKKQGSLSVKILSDFIKAPSKFIGATLIGNNIALVIYGIVMAQFLSPYIDKLIPNNYQSELLHLFIQTIISTIVILIVGEFFPKIIFRINPNKVLRIFIIPFYGLYYLIYPLVVVSLQVSRLIIQRLFKIDYEEDSPIFTSYDLQHFIEQSSGSKDSEAEIDTALFENALELTNEQVRNCMVPRTEIEAVEVSSSIDELKQKFLETKLSKILVYEESIDNILGYVHHFELWKKNKDIKSIIKQIPVAPETMSANEMLNLLIKENKSIACVVDEFGGTAGIVTLEDILEEIFGEIEDEHDLQDLIERKISSTEYMFSGRIEIDYINEKYHLDIPEGEYETLAGFIISNHGNIPEEKEQITISHFLFTILYVSDTKIETVKLKILPQS